MDKQLNELNEKVSILIRMAGLALTRDKPQREKIGLLGLTGLTPKEIAQLLETTSNTVSVELSKSRKAKRKPGKQAKTTQ